MRGFLVPGEGLRSKNNDKFVYCSYWKVWSRVLREGNGYITSVEVDLTAINGRCESDWSSTRELNVREHQTVRRPGDLIVDALPHDVLELMRKWMDESLIEQLLHDDLLVRIDWTKYRQYCNGGAAFARIAMPYVPSAI